MNKEISISLSHMERCCVWWVFSTNEDLKPGKYSESLSLQLISKLVNEPSSADAHHSIKFSPEEVADIKRFSQAMIDGWDLGVDPKDKTLDLAQLNAWKRLFNMTKAELK